jgi:hypothetical protein
MFGEGTFLRERFGLATMCGSLRPLATFTPFALHQQTVGEQVHGEHMFRLMLEC